MSVTSIEEHKATTDLAVLVAADKKERGERCVEIVNNALKEHNCIVNIFVVLDNQRIPIGRIVGAQVEISIDPQNPTG